MDLFSVVDRIFGVGGGRCVWSAAVACVVSEVAGSTFALVCRYIVVVAAVGSGTVCYVRVDEQSLSVVCAGVGASGYQFVGVCYAVVALASESDMDFCRQFCVAYSCGHRFADVAAFDHTLHSLYRCAVYGGQCGVCYRFIDGGCVVNVYDYGPECHCHSDSVGWHRYHDVYEFFRVVFCRSSFGAE